jgi:hypothetical protein
MADGKTLSDRDAVLRALESKRNLERSLKAAKAEADLAGSPPALARAQEKQAGLVLQRKVDLDTT